MSYNPQVSPDGKVLRAATTSLGATFDSANVITYRMQNFNQLLLFCTVAGFDATSVEIKVQAALTAGDTAPASGDWFDLAAQGSATTSGTDATFPIRTAIFQMLGNDQIVIPVPACYKWVRAVGQRTGGTTATTLAITAMQGMA
jgi:hypothetical protein